MSGRRLIITLTNPIPPEAELSKVLSIILYKKAICSYILYLLAIAEQTSKQIG